MLIAGIIQADTEFLGLGALTVPPVLVTATVALWISLRLVG